MKLISQRLKQKVSEKNEGKRVRVPGHGEFIAVDDSEASDVGSPRFEADTGAEAPTAASGGVGTAPMNTLMWKKWRKKILTSTSSESGKVDLVGRG